MIITEKMLCLAINLVFYFKVWLVIMTILPKYVMKIYMYNDNDNCKMVEMVLMNMTCPRLANV